MWTTALFIVVGCGSLRCSGPAGQARTAAVNEDPHMSDPETHSACDRQGETIMATDQDLEG